MWSNYILTSLRTLQRNKFFVGVNLFSIAVAFSLVTIAYFNIEFNRDFNKVFENAHQIFKVNASKLTADGERLMGISPLPLATALQNDLEGVTASAYHRQNSLVKLEDQLFRESVAYVDDQFFDIFSQPLLSGETAQFRQETEVFLTEEVAIKLFGDSTAIGHTIQLVDAHGKKTPFTVAGVLKDLPRNSSFLHSIIAPFSHYLQANELENEDWSTWVDATFFKTERAGDLAPLLNRYLPIQNEVNEGLQVAHYEISNILDWAAFENSMLHGSFMGYLHPASVLGTVSSAITVLLLACFNFVNTSIAISRKRLREIGMRKVLGSRKKDLRIQFLVESGLQMLIAMALSGLVTMILIDPYNAMFNFEIVEFERINLAPFLGFAALTWLITSLMAGMYPAFYISKFRSVEIFRNRVRFSGKNLFTRILLTFQFVVCVYNVFSLILFTQNAQYQEGLDRGYEVRSSINIPLTQPAQFAALKPALEKMPEVTEVTGTVHPIGFSLQNRTISHLGEEIDVAAVQVGEKYLEALKIRLAEGSFFTPNQSGNEQYVLINQMLYNQLGESTLNEWVSLNDKRYTVIGVVDDFNLRPIMLDNKIRPTVIFYAPESTYKYANVVVEGKALVMDKKLQTVWAGLYPDELYLGFLQEDVMDDVRQTNQITISINGVVAVITLLISALGLYALVYLNIQSRIKEFGVRKVLGASIGQILYLLNRQVIVMLAIAGVLGLVAGRMVISQILDIVYAYHKEIEVNNYIWPLLITFGIAIASIGWRALQSARQNPVEQLRTE